MDANEKKVVPLVVYGPEGERKVIGSARIEAEETVMQIDDADMWERVTENLLGLDALSIGVDPTARPKDGDSMEFTTFIRKPFTVEAVEVTESNFESIAALTGTIQEKSDGTPYIETNRKLVPNVFRIYIGFWLTRLNGDLRAYSAKTFAEMFSSEEVAHTS